MKRGPFIENRWADGFVINQLEQLGGGRASGVAAKNMHPGLDLFLHPSLPGLAPTGLTASYCGCEKFGGLAITSRADNKELSLILTWGILLSQPSPWTSCYSSPVPGAL